MAKEDEVSAAVKGILAVLQAGIETPEKKTSAVVKGAQVVAEASTKTAEATEGGKPAAAFLKAIQAGALIGLGDAVSSGTALFMGAAMVPTLPGTIPLPTTMDKALLAAEKYNEVASGLFDKIFIASTSLSSIPFVDLEVPFGWSFNDPRIRHIFDIATEGKEAWFKYGATPLLQRHYQKYWQPNIPGYADMISIYVREGYLEEKWVEIPEEFVKNMQELGYPEDWTKRLWGKHWVLPGVNHLYEMFHKKIITYDEMAAMLKYHDFEPVWRDRLIRNAYAMIPRVDLRRGYVWGLLGAEELQARYEKLGYSVPDATIMTGIAKRFGLSAYYSRLLTVAAATFRKGQLSGPDFQAWMEVCGLPREAQDLLLSAESMARDAAVTQPGEEPRILSASQICGAYTKGLLSPSAARDRLLGMGYLEGDADLLLALAAPKPQAEAPSTEIVSAASLLYRNGWMSPEEFTGWLRKANLTDEEIQVTRDAQDLRYWLDYATDLLALWKQMYAKDIITLDEFYSNLLKWGCQPDRAWTIVSLEETRKIPKPRAAG